jgi:hypothetical protein
MTYKYYKFPNKETAPPLNKWPQNVSVNEIGVIVNNDGVFDEYGEIVNPPTVKPGWHVNVCYQGNVNLEFVKQYEINVQTPMRTWLGQEV